MNMQVTDEQRTAVVASLLVDACFETHNSCKTFIRQFHGHYDWEQTMLMLLGVQDTTVYEYLRLYEAASEVMESNWKFGFLKSLAQQAVEQLEELDAHPVHIAFLRRIAQTYYGVTDGVGANLSAAAEKKPYECLRAQEQASAD